MPNPVRGHALGGKALFVKREFTHEALLYEHGRDAAAFVTSVVTDALDNDAAVICSMAPPLQAAVRSGLSTHGDVLWLSADDSYGRPVNAIAEWSSFLRRRGHGVTRFEAIGQPPYNGTAEDQPWYWYDAAVNAVFGDEPLNALCLIDRVRVSDATMTAICRSHSRVRDTTGALVPTPVNGSVSFDAPRLSHPCLTRTPNLAVVMASVRQARHALLHLVRDRSQSLRMRAELVLAELVTNAIEHGGTTADIELWFTPTDVVMRVRDRGPGIDDPWATLRPPRREQVGGAGLWIAHRESEALDVRTHPEGGTVAVAVLRERAD